MLSMQVGSVIPFAGSTIPSGYLLCDGSAVSRTTYSDLFAVVGTTYGAGDESTTFNLPNLSGKVPVGVSVSHAIGSSGGSETVALQTNEIPTHEHEVPQHGHSDDFSFETSTLTHSVSSQPSFTYTKHNSTVKLATTAKVAAYNSTSTPSMSRSTNFDVGAHNPADCSKTGDITDCPAFNTASAGSGNAHNNMMPFVAMKYIIFAVEP